MCLVKRERERDRTCVRACVVRIGRGATASAKGEAEGTHIFERDAPWTLGLARRPRVGGREGEISVGPLLCTRGVKQRSQRGEETLFARIWFVWFFGRVRKHGGERRRSWSPRIGLGR